MNWLLAPSVVTAEAVQSGCRPVVLICVAEGSSSLLPAFANKGIQTQLITVTVLLRFFTTVESSYLDV